MFSTSFTVLLTRFSVLREGVFVADLISELDCMPDDPIDLWENGATAVSISDRKTGMRVKNVEVEMRGGSFKMAPVLNAI